MDAYSIPPKDKSELLAWIETEWQSLQNTIQGLDEMQMTTPDDGGWSIKDNLAHLAEWERYLVFNHLRGLPPHEVWGFESDAFDRLEEDDQNDLLFRRDRDRTTPEILTMLQESHELVLSELEGWRFDDLLKPRFQDDPEKRSVGLFVAGNTYFHYIEHRQTIEKLIRQLSDA